MQERCLRRAESAGCVVRRGVRATSVARGSQPSATVEQDQSIEELRARIVVVADGRVSELRSRAGFTVQRDAEEMYLAGVLLDGVTAVADEASTFVLHHHRAQPTSFRRGKDECARISGTIVWRRIGFPVSELSANSLRKPCAWVRDRNGLKKPELRDHLHRFPELTPGWITHTRTALRFWATQPVAMILSGDRACPLRSETLAFFAINY
jgi:2-polyprenyl-6-methoxyphenol hydroxylase-like FAD-dependent oxidoreductase